MEEFDEEGIGVLAIPPLSLADIAAKVSADYEFLADEDEAEHQAARAKAKIDHSY
ncbi:MAG: hypothetical protein GY722_15820 [bacterium]|nr:hypothetical protein [bacterium]